MNKTPPELDRGKMIMCSDDNYTDDEDEDLDDELDEDDADDAEEDR